MSFDDLPEDLGSTPLREPSVQADLVDLILGIEDRRSGAVALMICDERDCGLQPVVVTDIPDDTDAAGMVRLLDLLLPPVREVGGSVLIGRGRRRGLVPTDRDRDWHQAAIRTCARHGVRLLGYHLASPDGVEPLPSPVGTYGE
jgi:hypothetical protein